jgi:hypothetical protein
MARTSATVQLLRVPDASPGRRRRVNRPTQSHTVQMRQESGAGEAWMAARRLDMGTR